jgi:Sugar phosphate isomerases/epimerases
MKIAYTGWTWLVNHKENRTYDLEQAIKECKSLGYDYLENFAFIADFYEDPNELKALLEKYDANMVNLYGHFRDNPETDYENCFKQIDFLAAIGGTHYNCQGNTWKEEPFVRPLNKEKILEYADLCNRLGAHAKEKGITLCFHPHANTAVFAEDQIDFFIANTDASVVKLCLDTAHTTIAGMCTVSAFDKFADRIAYVHLKDVDPTEAKSATPMKSFRALGLGIVDFVGVVNVLKKHGYDGVLCVELDNPEVCNYQSAQVSRKYIRNALKM